MPGDAAPAACFAGSGSQEALHKLRVEIKNKSGRKNSPHHLMKKKEDVRLKRHKESIPRRRNYPGSQYQPANDEAISY